MWILHDLTKEHADFMEKNRDFASGYLTAFELENHELLAMVKRHLLSSVKNGNEK